MLAGTVTMLRPVADADLELLVAWHADPEVARYWDDETYTVDSLREELSDDDVEPYVVEADGEPVGFLQAWWEEGKPQSAGLDMFLIPSARGRGLGPDAARTLALHLLDERGVAEVTVDPYTWNEPAIRAWGRAGFRPVEERPPDADRKHRWLLMRFAR